GDHGRRRFRRPFHFHEHAICLHPQPGGSVAGGGEKLQHVAADSVEWRLGTVGRRGLHHLKSPLRESGGSCVPKARNRAARSCTSRSASTPASSPSTSTRAQ